MKKRIQIFSSFEELEAENLRSNIEASLQERWDTFWKLKRQHRSVFYPQDESNPTKKRITISKPSWI